MGAQSFHRFGLADQAIVDKIPGPAELIKKAEIPSRIFFAEASPAEHSERFAGERDGWIQLCVSDLFQNQIVKLRITAVIRIMKQGDTNEIPVLTREISPIVPSVICRLLNFLADLSEYLIP